MGVTELVSKLYRFCVEIVLADTGYIEVQYTEIKSEQIECTCHTPKPRCAAPRTRAWGGRHTPVRSCGFEPSLDITAPCEPSSLRCPETLFISHEHANFLFSVFRVVQGEAKTSKIMGCCRAIFAFLHALKIGTFRGKWTLEWVFKTSQFFRLALYFLINSKLAFSLYVSERCLKGTAKIFLI